MQSKAINLNIQKVNIDDLIKSIIKKFDILKENNGYNISYKGFNTSVKCDKTKMEQVIYNLLNNAINYTGDDKKVYVKLKEENGGIKLEIKDTGKGISDEDLKYIWDKYYKVDKKYKRVTHGTGLGLSIVKNILDLHGFKYGVESKKNKGTTFYIYF